MLPVVAKLAVSTVVRIVTATTATPAPCGVGTVCDERAVGRTIANRASSGRSSRTRPYVAMPAAATVSGARIVHQDEKFARFMSSVRAAQAAGDDENGDFMLSAGAEHH